jgi:L-lactate dehydrogenase complex protein LldG
MDRLLHRIREALAASPRRPWPPLPEPAPAEPADALAARFAEALHAAGGRFFTAPDEDAARAAVGGGNVALDRADLLIADTGTVVRCYASAEESRVSLWPESSAFLAAPAALVPDLPSALARLAPIHRAGRAFTVLITGPSRTADIEKELVIPAHGPRELTVVLVSPPSGR